ncbi:MAG: DUF4202 domain-containing protein [Hyphomicrobiales bacterium]
MPDRLVRVLAAIDLANAADPDRSPDGEAQALLYGRRMSATLAQFAPGASEALQIAARGQHIERWTIPRSSYPEGRVAYLTWRRDLQKHHAARCGEIMKAEGYGDADIARVGALLRKERLKQDAEVQILEDVICLVFLAHEADAFIAKHDDAKVRDILAKTSRKMSPDGIAAASRLRLSPRLGRLLGEALSS